MKYCSHLAVFEDLLLGDGALAEVDLETGGGGGRVLDLHGGGVLEREGVGVEEGAGVVEELEVDSGLEGGEEARHESVRESRRRSTAGLAAGESWRNWQRVQRKARRKAWGWGARTKGVFSPRQPTWAARWQRWQQAFSQKRLNFS